MPSSSSHSRRRKRPRSPAARDWAALPSDILFAVFLKLGRAGAVAVRRHVTVLALLSPKGRAKLRAAMGRSAGQCEPFTASNCDFASLSYVVERAHSLKSLRLPDCGEINVGWTIRKRLPPLEHLEVSLIGCNTSVSENHFLSICEACPCLKKLSLRFRNVFGLENHFYDKGIIGIHDGLIKCPIPRIHELRSLQLVYSGLTKKKLMAIIDSCPVLESLQISHRISIDEVEELHVRYARLKILRADYEY